MKKVNGKKPFVPRKHVAMALLSLAQQVEMQLQVILEIDEDKVSREDIGAVLYWVLDQTGRLAADMAPFNRARMIYRHKVALQCVRELYELLLEHKERIDASATGAALVPYYTWCCCLQALLHKVCFTEGGRAEVDAWVTEFREALAA